MRALVFFLACLIGVSVPSIALANGCGSPGAYQEVSVDFMKQTSINLDMTPLTIGKPAVVLPYALQPWGTTNGGGQALLKYDSAKGWVLLSGGGGEWDVPSLVTMGVPQSIAKKLVSLVSSLQHHLHDNCNHSS